MAFSFKTRRLLVLERRRFRNQIREKYLSSSWWLHAFFGKILPVVAVCIFVFLLGYLSGLSSFARVVQEQLICVVRSNGF